MSAIEARDLTKVYRTYRKESGLRGASAWKGSADVVLGVLADIDDRANIDAVYHLGDLTGYAPWPNEVVSLVRERAIPGISGNYDSTVAANYKHCGCRADTPHEEELSHMSFEWTLSPRDCRRGSAGRGRIAP
jgi:hypothetical protein